MTRLNIKLRVFPQVFKEYNDGKTHVMEVVADVKTGKVEIRMDGVLQDSDAVVTVGDYGEIL